MALFSIFMLMCGLQTTGQPWDRLLLHPDQLVDSMYERGYLYVYFLNGRFSRIKITDITIQDITVAPAGGDYTNIQQALNHSIPGDRILIRSGTYYEKLSIPFSGNETDGAISLMAYPGEYPVLDGSGVSGANMIYAQEQSWITLEGLTIRNNTNVNDGSGIRFSGACQNITIRNNEIYNMLGNDAMGITFYGTNVIPASNIVITANVIHHCDAAHSEALVLNGNITHFLVQSNRVHDINNIGIDFIGGEADITTNGVCRNGECLDNLVYNCRSSYGDGYAAGIYVDGGKNIRVAGNIVHDCDLGIEIGAENAGTITTEITVSSIIIFDNDKVGLIFGGYEQSVGRVANCEFLNNICYKNDTLGVGYGEILIQWATNNVLRNNIAYSASNLVLTSYGGNSNNVLDYNLWYSEKGYSNTLFIWNGTTYVGLSAYTNATGQDRRSLFADPLLLDPVNSNFHLAATSPAIDKGDPSYLYRSGDKDMDGQSRIMGGRIEMGPDEITHFWAWRDAAFASLGDLYLTNKNDFIFSRQGDYDQDGFSNYGECVGVTDPLDENSLYAIDIRRSVSGMDILMPTHTNRTYQLQICDTLPSYWQNFGAAFIGLSNTTSHICPDSTMSSGSFYRVVISE